MGHPGVDFQVIASLRDTLGPENPPWAAHSLNKLKERTAPWALPYSEIPTELLGMVHFT
jgi:hypothetical protein